MIKTPVDVSKQTHLPLWKAGKENAGVSCSGEIFDVCLAGAGGGAKSEAAGGVGASARGRCRERWHLQSESGHAVGGRAPLMVRCVEQPEHRGIPEVGGASGRWHGIVAPGRGPVGGILLGLRETVKHCGRARTRLRLRQQTPAAITPSPAAQVVITPPPQQPGPMPHSSRLTLPTDREKPEHGTEAKHQSKHQRIQNTGNQIGTAYYHKYRRIQKPDRHSEPS